MSFINKTIQTLWDFCEYLESESNRISGDKDKVFLFARIHNLSYFLINNFACCFPSNEEFLTKHYQIKEGKKIKTTLKGELILRLCKRIFVSEIWNAFENFFQSKTGQNGEIGRSLLKEYYENDDDIPNSINFLRGTRNSLHNNGMYGIREKPLVFNVGSKIYKLEPGKIAEVAGSPGGFPPLIEIVKECLDNL